VSQGKFFAIGSEEFKEACQIGMNAAVTFIVLARGTGRDNATTSWSALSVFKYSGMARRRAKDAIDALVAANLVEILKSGKTPRYRLRKPDDDSGFLWLPNEIVDGAANEVPPITKLRETGNLEWLEIFILLYGFHDLDNDGGLTRDIARSVYDRTKICPIQHYILYGFTHKETTATNGGLFAGYGKREDEQGNRGPWVVLNPLKNLGLLEITYYLAESGDDDAELIYPMNAETQAAHQTLIDWLEESGGRGFALEALAADYIGLAPGHIEKAAMVGLLRLRYRPKTGKTARWWAIERESTEAIVGVIDNICTRRETMGVHIKAFQGS
tara:strand:+ start:2914 stop:3897 length:984 start_codon:yes stop_codon:yes gene_type:complete